jgi:quercetin dioxygenase-like cupin family protein
MKWKISVRRIAGAAIALCPLIGYAADPAARPAGIEGAELMTRELIGDPSKEVLMLTVTYQGGSASLPHRHDAQTFVYVLEGEMTMQVDGSAPVTLHPGQTFYEGRDDIHRISANASKTTPAKILVLMIKDKGKPDTTRVTDKAKS